MRLFFPFDVHMFRLTSGLIVLAKDKNTAAKVSGEIRKKSTQKVGSTVSQYYS